MHRHKAFLFDRKPPEIPEEIGFRTDAFTADQKAVIEQILQRDPRVDAVALGGVLPPEANPKNGWVRTVFTRVVDVDLVNQVEVNELFKTLHKNIMANKKLFEDMAFTFRIMTAVMVVSW